MTEVTLPPTSIKVVLSPLQARRLDKFLAAIGAAAWSLMILMIGGAEAGDSVGTHAGFAQQAPDKQDDGAGIWKSAVPPVAMKGEFGNHDPIGLANGQLIKADCSINWTDPDTRKLYCFSVPTSLAYFLYWPKRNIARATREWTGHSPLQLVP